MSTDLNWVPESCALPTADRPLRLAEFDDLLRVALLAQVRPSRTKLRWHLDPTHDAVARDLAAREASCCSFFTFTFEAAGDVGLPVDVEVPATHTEILDALAARAAALLDA